jgi:arginyl-tRNA synthetase
LNAENQAVVAFRVELCRVTAEALKRALGLLGIEAPERM